MAAVTLWADVGRPYRGHPRHDSYVRGRHPAGCSGEFGPGWAVECLCFLAHLFPPAAVSRRDGPGLGPTHRSGRRLRHPGPAHRDVPVPAWPGQALYLALCDQPLVGHGTHAPQAAGPLFFAGARAAGGALCAGRASKRLTSCTASAFHRPPTFRNRAITGFARRLQRARGRWRACLEKRCAELFHLVRPRRGGARQRASQHRAPPRVRGRR